MPDTPMGPAVVINIQYGGGIDPARIEALEALMATEAEQIGALHVKVDDLIADVRAARDILEGERDNLGPDGQAALDTLTAKVDAFDAEVGDADGSDTPVPPVEPVA